MTDDLSPGPNPGTSGLLSRIVSIAILVGAVTAGWALWPGADNEDAAAELKHSAAAGGAHHGPLSLVCNLPGVESPDFVLADSQSLKSLKDSVRVIGVMVDTVPHAFAIDTLKNPLRHIVNIVDGGKSLSVSYCDRADTARVFTGGKSKIDLRVGGLNDRNELVYLLDGVRYDLSSPEIPLDDYPFEMTTLGAWKVLNPGTKVFFLQQTEEEKKADAKRLQQLMQNARIRATGKK